MFAWSRYKTMCFVWFKLMHIWYINVQTLPPQLAPLTHTTCEHSLEWFWLWAKLKILLEWFDLPYWCTDALVSFECQGRGAQSLPECQGQGSRHRSGSLNPIFFIILFNWSQNMCYEVLMEEKIVQLKLEPPIMWVPRRILNVKDGDAGGGFTGVTIQFRITCFNHQLMRTFSHISTFTFLGFRSRLL